MIMRLIMCSLMALLLVPGQAHAQRGDSRDAKELIRQAEQLYEQKLYLKAAEALEKANELMPDTRLIYNIARAYDQAGKLQESLSQYERYLVDGEDAQLRKRAMSAINRLRLLQEKEAEAAAERQRLQQEAEAARWRAAAEREAALKAEQAHKLSLNAAYEDALASRTRMQVASISLGGVALAAASVGTVFGLKAQDARKAFNVATELDPKLAAKESTRKNALMADIGFGVGLVSAVAAVLMYPKRPAPKPGEVLLTATSQGTGAGLEVSF